MSEIHQIIKKNRCYLTKNDASPHTTNQVNTVQARDGKPFVRRLPKLSIYFKEILSQAYEHFEEQNRVLESFTIIINYPVITINAYYNYIISAQ